MTSGTLQSIDDAIKEQLDNPASKTDKMPETRNEKIDGDSATLELHNEDTKKWDKMYFVKEDGTWKALDPADKPTEQSSTAVPAPSQPSINNVRVEEDEDVGLRSILRGELVGGPLADHGGVMRAAAREGLHGLVAHDQCYGLWK